MKRHFFVIRSKFSHFSSPPFPVSTPVGFGKSKWTEEKKRISKIDQRRKEGRRCFFGKKKPFFFSFLFHRWVVKCFFFLFFFF